MVLVGYRLGLTIDDIYAFGRAFGVSDCLECYENLSQNEVNVQLNRARVNVIWSRKEGVNRAIVEGMFANVPCVVREGFNYGHRYEYVNAFTGAFASERALPRTLLELIERSDSMRPRDWVMEHMSCQRSTQILQRIVDDGTDDAGETAIKVNGLHGMHYWDETDAARFAADYEFLRRHRAGAEVVRDAFLLSLPVLAMRPAVRSGTTIRRSEIPDDAPSRDFQSVR